MVGSCFEGTRAISTIFRDGSTPDMSAQAMTVDDMVFLQHDSRIGFGERGNGDNQEAQLAHGQRRGARKLAG